MQNHTMQILIIINSKKSGTVIFGEEYKLRYSLCSFLQLLFIPLTESKYSQYPVLRVGQSRLPFNIHK
jgi:hypothetical protein